VGPSYVPPDPPPVSLEPSPPPAGDGGDRGGGLVVAAGVLVGILVIVMAVVLGYYWVGPNFGSGALGVCSVSSSSAPPVLGRTVPIPALGSPIQVGKTPTFVAVSPNGRQAYIANKDPQLVTVVDTAVNQVTATIPIPAGPPRFLAFAPDGQKLYVTIYND